jgi:cytoskeletal protein RodZ
MAPTHFDPTTGQTTLHALLPRAASDPSNVPLASIFAFVNSRAVQTISSRSTLSSFSSTLPKRQQYILAIPTTYDGLNSGPAPGAVAGITLGSVFGAILLLYLILLILRQYTGRSIVQTEIIESHHHHNHRSRRSRSRSTRSQMTERRRTVREETTRVERSVSRPRPMPEESVVVEEEEDDIVEVIEEQSPERRPSRKSGYRTVDPAEFGGGSGARRKLSRR